MATEESAVILRPENVLVTIEKLSLRIEERFPGSGLSRTCQELLAIGREAEARADLIGRPIYLIRIGSLLLIALIALGLLATLINVGMPQSDLHFFDLVQILEAGINDVVLIGAGLYFLLSFEVRLKRKKALKSMHQLRSIAHVIDMHQLTKDPERLLKRGVDTKSSPQETMSAFELSRYLDYCSEMVSLVGKVAALHVQHFDDSVALAAVNELESLSTGLSRKVWQKLMILHSQDFEAPLKASQ